jgi:polyisoprenoid-binding protein YceI
MKPMTRQRTLLVGLALLLGTTLGCGGGGTSKPNAPSPAAETGGGAGGGVGAAAGNYTVDNVHSSLVWGINHMGVGYIYGRFKEMSGTFKLDEKDAAGHSFNFEVKADGIDSNNTARDGHLKGPDFFSVKEFPTIMFKSTAVKPAGDKQYDVTGDLTLHGVTKPVTARLELIGSKDLPAQMGGYKTGFKGRFTLSRKEFQVTGGRAGGMLGDEVEVLIAFEGGRK